MAINDCCKVRENLEVKELLAAKQTTIRVCRVCGRRHFEVVAQPVKIGATFPKG